LAVRNNIGSEGFIEGVGEGGGIAATFSHSKNENNCDSPEGMLMARTE
jgi:hypothetical protein